MLSSQSSRRIIPQDLPHEHIAAGNKKSLNPSKNTPHRVTEITRNRLWNQTRPLLGNILYLFTEYLSVLPHFSGFKTNQQIYYPFQSPFIASLSNYSSWFVAHCVFLLSLYRERTPGRRARSWRRSWTGWCSSFSNSSTFSWKTKMGKTLVSAKSRRAHLQQVRETS